MIWGMTLEPGKIYTEIMGEEVQLSMAAIDSRKDLDETPSTNFCQIVIQTETGEYVLCTLVHGVIFQQNLDLKLMPREKVTFSVQGPSVVYLVGYTASYPEDEETTNLEAEDYQKDYPAWEPFHEGDEMTDVKPVEDLRDSESNDKRAVQEQIAVREHVEGGITEEARDEEEMIFSVAAVDPTEVKTEPPDPETGPPVHLEEHAQSELRSPTHDDLYRMQTTDNERNLPQTTAPQEPHHQQHSDIPLSPPVAFQPITSGPEYQNSQRSLLPPGDIFLPAPVMERVMANPAGHPFLGGRRNAHSANRTYPIPRRQYGANRVKTPGRGRGRGRPPRSFQQQNESLQRLQQGPVPGASQESAPGASVSGMVHQEQPISNQNTEPLDPPQKCVGYRCRVCGKWFTNKTHLITHRRIHTGERPYVCDYCGKSTTTKSNLTVHMRVHTGEKPFVCNICHRSFNAKSSLNRHQDTQHSLV